MGRREQETQYSVDNSQRKGLNLKGLPSGQQDMMRTLKWRRRLERAGCIENFVRRYCLRLSAQPITQAEVLHERTQTPKTVRIADLLTENVVVELRSLQTA
jgi:hypothetical protein